MPRQRIQASQADEEREKIITIREDAIYNYEDIIEKICGRKKPLATKLLRIKAFTPGAYRIRDGRTNRLTPEHINIVGSNKLLWIQLTNEQARQILATNKEPLFGNYIRDLKALLKRHEHAYMNHPFMYLHDIEYIPRPMQQDIKQFDSGKELKAPLEEIKWEEFEVKTEDNKEEDAE